MNRLARHISYLLLNCRKVYVPGLGTFSALYHRANFNSDSGIFLPSRIGIKFSEEKSEDDNLLISSLQRKLKITEDEALNLISEFVDLIKTRLSKRRYCRLNGVGYLYLDSDDNIILRDSFWGNPGNPILSSPSN